LVAGVLVAADDFRRLHGAVQRAAFLVLNALAAVAVELIELAARRIVVRGIRLDRDQDETETKQSRPTGPPARSRGSDVVCRIGRRFGGNSGRAFDDCPGQGAVTPCQ
jgi:hypothetical protein